MKWSPIAWANYDSLITYTNVKEIKKNIMILAYRKLVFIEFHLKLFLNGFFFLSKSKQSNRKIIDAILWFTFSVRFLFAVQGWMFNSRYIEPSAFDAIAFASLEASIKIIVEFKIQSEFPFFFFQSTKNVYIDANANANTRCWPDACDKIHSFVTVFSLVPFVCFLISCRLYVECVRMATLFPFAVYLSVITHKH